MLGAKECFSSEVNYSQNEEKCGMENVSCTVDEGARQSACFLGCRAGQLCEERPGSGTRQNSAVRSTPAPCGRKGALLDDASASDLAGMQCVQTLKPLHNVCVYVCFPRIRSCGSVRVVLRATRERVPRMTCGHRHRRRMRLGISSVSLRLRHVMFELTLECHLRLFKRNDAFGCTYRMVLK
ncbi:Protein of unknown function [Gryllus bimaculatus]|nr:Protein of unknown function [Gryllus bimaculatus]